MIKLSELDKAAKAVAAGAIALVTTLPGGLAVASSTGHVSVWSLIAVAGTTLAAVAGGVAGVYVTSNTPSSPPPATLSSPVSLTTNVAPTSSVTIPSTSAVASSSSPPAA